MDQIILSVDDSGKFLEYIPKELGHKGAGRRHLAIAVLLTNSKGEVLLQKRKHKIFDNIWDLTGATHPLHLEDRDESLEEATLRCLKEEWGVQQKITLENLGFFNYFAAYSEFCENEHCYLLTGEYNGNIDLNKNMGYEYKWMSKQDFLVDIKSNPQKYTPWAQEAMKVIQKRKEGELV